MNHEGFAYLIYKFTNPYLIINGTKCKVSNNCYHAAVLFSKCKEVDNIFKQNFYKSFKPLLPKEYNNCKMEVINFKALDNIRLKTKPLQSKYGNVFIGNMKYKLSNYIVEPLHIFKGRGNHPQRGTLKFPTMPEQITLNCKKSPPCMLVGHNWGNIINDSNVSWAGFYKDSFGTSRYMYPLLNDDVSKFDTARYLKKKLHSIRNSINDHCVCDNLRKRQKATAAYLIDKLCIRVGHPKESDSADTVGCCTLRVEHIEVNKNSIKLSFLGKDSIEYKKTFCPHSNILKNLKEFCNNKKPSDLIFHTIDACSLNTYLNSLCPGLTAKQFRTCHASNKFEHLLQNYNPAIDGNIIKYYKQCNKKVAELCNHKRGNSLSNETSKANYIDPRIIFSFSKKHNIPIENLLSQSLIQKHDWAKNASVEFKF